MLLSFQPVEMIAKWCILALFGLCVLTQTSNGQQVVDKIVATVSDGIDPEIITLSDLRWQLALQPNIDLESADSETLNRALELQINQRIFALEAKKLPRTSATEKEINDKIMELLTYFRSPVEFENRLKAVGFRSIKDDNFERMIEQRIAIDKYLDFRFRTFVVVSAEEEAAYYRDFYEPDFRARFPGVIVPTLDEKRAEINEILTEDRVGADIEAFLDEAKRRVEIEILSRV